MLNIHWIALILLIVVTMFTTAWGLVAWQLRTDSSELEGRMDKIDYDLFHLTRVINWHAGLTVDEDLERRWHEAVQNEAPKVDTFGDAGTPKPGFELHLVQPNVEVVDAMLLVPYYGD